MLALGRRVDVLGARRRRRAQPRRRRRAHAARACSPPPSCSRASPSPAAGPIGFVAFIAPHIARRLAPARRRARCRGRRLRRRARARRRPRRPACCSRRPRSRSGSSRRSSPRRTSCAAAARAPRGGADERAAQARGLTRRLRRRRRGRRARPDVPRERITAVVGANGCGKSTLLRALARLIAPRAGSVLLDGRAIRELAVAGRSRAGSGCSRSRRPRPTGLTVEDLVARGRYPHQGLFRQWSPSDEAAVEEALAATGMGDLRDRPLDELSGGQRQRAWIAMTLAQQTELLLLDEPTTFLDLAHQIDVLDLLDGLVAERGRTVVMVLHDINQACRYADQLVAVRDGRVHAAGRARRDRRRRVRPRRLRARGPRRRGPRDRHPAVPPDRPAKENPMRHLNRPRRGAALALVARRLRRRRDRARPRARQPPSAFPVTVEHKFGTTEVEATPKRVVTVGYTDQDAMLALGVVPVGVGDFLGGYDWRKRPWAQDALERRRAGGRRRAADQLRGGRRAAPGPDHRDQRRAQEGRLRQALARSRRPSRSPATTSTSACRGTSRRCSSARRSAARTQAEKVVADVKAKFAARSARRTREFEGKTAILAYGGPDGYGAYATQDTRSRFLADLGFKTPDEGRRARRRLVLRPVQPGAVPAHGPGRRRHVRRPGGRPRQPGVQAPGRRQARTA